MLRNQGIPDENTPTGLKYFIEDPRQAPMLLKAGCTMF